MWAAAPARSPRRWCGGVARPVPSSSIPTPPSIELARSRGLDGFAGTIEEYETGRALRPDPDAELGRARRRPGRGDGEGGAPARAGGADLDADAEFPGARRHPLSASELGGLPLPAPLDDLQRAGVEPGTRPRESRRRPIFRRTQGGGFWAQSLLGLRRERVMRGGRLPAAWAPSDSNRFAAQAAGPLPRLPAARRPVHRPRLRHSRRAAGVSRSRCCARRGAGLYFLK